MKIIVNIEAGENGKCWLCGWWSAGECDLFGGQLGLDPMCDYRAPECLLAEQKLKDLIDAGTGVAKDYEVGGGEARFGLMMELIKALAALKERT